MTELGKFRVQIRFFYGFSLDINYSNHKLRLALFEVGVGRGGGRSACP